MPCKNGSCFVSPVTIPQPQPGVYLHYKGEIYEVLGIAVDTDSEAHEETIWYQNVCTGQKYTRKRTEWLKPARIVEGDTVYEVPRYIHLTRMRRHMVQEGQMFFALQPSLPLQARIGITEVTISAGIGAWHGREQAFRNAPWNQYQLVTAPLGQSVYADTKAGDYVICVSGSGVAGFGVSYEVLMSAALQWRHDILAQSARPVAAVAEHEMSEPS